MVVHYCDRQREKERETEREREKETERERERERERDGGVIRTSRICAFTTYAIIHLAVHYCLHCVSKPTLFCDFTLPFV